MSKKKVAVISLGCDKNRVDTEKMLFSLTDGDGYEITQDTSQADILLVNTCGFIESAKKESIDAILDMAQIKKEFPEKKLVVAGCLSQRYGKELFEEIKEADAVIGIEGRHYIREVVGKLENGNKRILDTGKTGGGFQKGRVITTPYHYAYLKIADGCDNRCSYCVIPLIRGSYRSERMEDILEEADSLVEQGVKELILVAQDTTLYGKDLYGAPMLKELINKLSQIKDIWKIRLLYAYPERVDRELIEIISQNPKVAKYIDIPLQHINDAILKRMNRKTLSDGIKDKLKMIKDIDGDIAVRSSFIIGFNGEDRQKYLELKDFLAHTREIDYAGFFGYSIEEGLPASRFIEGNVDQAEIDRRVEDIQKLWSQKTIALHQKYAGKTLEVIYEGIDYDKMLFYGRNEHNAPDIDTKVYFSARKPLEIGGIYKVKITRADFDLYGHAI